MGSFSIWHWLIVLAVVILVFGTKKLRNLGSDLGSAVKGFKDGLKEGSEKESHESANASHQTTPSQATPGQATPSLANHHAGDIIDVQAHEKPAPSKPHHD